VAAILRAGFSPFACLDSLCLWPWIPTWLLSSLGVFLQLAFRPFPCCLHFRIHHRHDRRKRLLPWVSLCGYWHMFSSHL
jgi:hypothetical protein